ncbi:MAG TPA: suppressor of fused domain protein [Chitinophagales bacterium]|nr:suppressor of fused domain protein [Chitinophagales bacterium]
MYSKTDLYKKNFTKDDAPGLNAINEREKSIYGEQEPTHWATLVPYELGGEDPLWAVNCFTSDNYEKHFHYISLGFTNLFYDEGFAEDLINGFGFELTFRHLPFEDDPEKPVWVVNLLQNIAKYVFSTKNIFDEYHYMSANGPIRGETETDITAIVFCRDPEMQELETPHGRVKFLQLFGITTQEYKDLKEKKNSPVELLQKHRKTNPLLITDLSRK